MGRFTAVVESQAAQLAGTPSGTTFNGYFAAVVAGSAANFKLRRLFIGVRVVGTGFSTVTGNNMDPRGAATAITGIDITTATSAGTTGPTIGANKLREWSFNTQTGLDIPYEFLEEFICDQGTANGLALVNIGNALPASHLYTVDAEWEE